MADGRQSRVATSEDLPGVLALCARKTYAVWPSQAVASPKEAALRFLRESEARRSEYDLFVTQRAQTLTGFVVLKKQLIRGITGDRESVIQNHFALEVSDQESLFGQAAVAAREYASQFLTIEIAASDRIEQQRLQALGYNLESHRISVETADCPMPCGSPFTLRPAQPEDHFLIAVQNSTMLQHTLSAGRDYDVSALTFQAMGATFEQLAREDGKNVALVLTRGNELVAHLIIELTDKMGYIYDLAVAREHWGSPAVVHIMRAGSRLLYQENIPLFVGDVSASNMRALKVAQRALGFSVDCQRYGLRL